VVVDGVTGLLVPFEPAPSGRSGGGPADPARFAADLAAAVNHLLADPALAEAMGRAGRERVIEHFSWDAAAAKTIALYNSVAG
ncbi:MAG TPA: glycosyltransferase, partial [Actinomycetota bacterium]|nr:glycosyltransferase [Actinomycetota bacterium]